MQIYECTLYVVCIHITRAASHVRRNMREKTAVQNVDMPNKPTESATKEEYKINAEDINSSHLVFGFSLNIF